MKMQLNVRVVQVKPESEDCLISLIMMLPYIVSYELYTGYYQFFLMELHIMLSNGWSILPVHPIAVTRLWPKLSNVEPFVGP